MGTCATAGRSWDFTFGNQLRLEKAGFDGFFAVPRGRLMTESEQSGAPSFTEALKTWARIGVMSFGGPAGQIALMHKVLVDEKKWLEERTYLLALNFCTLLPGPEAMQLATYAGWRLHGVKGGLAAGLLFVIPGALVILALSALYAQWGAVPAVSAVFLGIKAAVLAIVVEALLRISKRSLKDSVEWGIAGAAFFAIFFLKVPFPLIVLGAALIGWWRGSRPGAVTPTPAVAAVPVPVLQTLRTIAIWLAVWIVPLLAVALAFGFDSVLAKLAWFFSKLAIVTFGGAYAVLAYMAQDVVQQYGWLTAGEMLDGLGLAETTPGPLILVTEFVGFLAAYRHGGGEPFLMGLLGALVVLWATFAPCFLWIFAGAPYIERIAGMPRLKSALSAITEAVVGVVLNLSLWFALHVIFRAVPEVIWGPLRFSLPELTSIDWTAAVLAVAAAFMLFRLHAGIAVVLGACGAAALALSVWS
ncbi:MAG: chromate efflux transporter [Hyphomicrobium sp.]